MNFPVRLELYGAVIAVASGLMLGGVMHPNLEGDDRPAGPQMIAGDAAMRAAGLPDTGATLASYGGRVPDYVVGTDARKAATWPPERIAPAAREPGMETDQEPADELPTISRAAYDEQRLARSHSYPSLGGAAMDDSDNDGPTTSD